ncbi:MAG TPA: HD domain-containing phosphohydrolase [Gemmataceae bacterium]|nr:HD domain-containing phosphohydrolase [Gemmataceae bacterium]
MQDMAVRRQPLRGSRGTIEFCPPSPAADLLEEVLASSIIVPEEYETLPAGIREGLRQHSDVLGLLRDLIKHRLLTEYQADCLESGKAANLIIGNYRVLDRLGAGAMGVVFKAEHLDLRRQVALKVLSPSLAKDPRVIQRFSTEMRAIAQLQHTHIVAAMDAGKWQHHDPDSPTIRYFVMEYVPGQDLEEHVLKNGPLSPAETCDLGHQIASALAEAHKHNLVHRDIKPSNVRLTPEGQAKLLDFGLARHLRSRMTEPGTLLGTMDYMAPEQASDAGSVDIRADIYGLGGTLFWCLAGRTPFLAEGSLTEEVMRRLTQPPPSVRNLRPEIPVELDAVLARMMALKPDDRYATPKGVMQALMPFLKPQLRDHLYFPSEPVVADSPKPAGRSPQRSNRMHHLLLVDDDAQIRDFSMTVLQSDDIQCDHAENGLRALEAIKKKRYDIVLLDIDMPRMTGPDVCRRLRENPPCPHMKIIMVSGRASSDEMASMLLAGADDYLTKPLSAPRLQARVHAALRLKDAQDHSDVLNQHLLSANHELEKNLNARDSDLVHARNAMVLALADLVGHRSADNGAHVVRMQRYCRCLAEEAARSASFAGQVDAHFIEMLECCAPLHDIGKAGLPDHILLKPGKLDADERLLMQTHTTIGADTLQKVARQHGFARAFLQMAVEIVRHHHERYDGRGYPDGLAGEDIPLAARIVAMADVYDALRSRRAYKPALSHATTVRMMVEDFNGHFDPSLIQGFERCASEFERIFREVVD